MPPPYRNCFKISSGFPHPEAFQPLHPTEVRRSRRLLGEFPVDAFLEEGEAGFRDRERRAPGLLLGHPGAVRAGVADRHDELFGTESQLHAIHP